MKILQRLTLMQFSGKVVDVNDARRTEVSEDN
jgi:hypothetical protein